MFALALLASASVALAAQAPQFAPPSLGPTVASANFTGASNTTLPKPTVVPGASFNRFIQIWLENTDFEVAASSAAFTTLAKEGLLLSQFYGVTHPSEPNYVASVGGDFFGLADDAFYTIPSNVSTIVDLLDQKNISWGSYQENMPTVGYTGFNYTSPNYLNASAPPYTYYVRKHNPLIIYDSVAAVPERAAKIRNFNDFAADVNASALPQWLFITPNLVNDAHDTTIDFASSWLEFWLLPLLQNPAFNDNHTLILLTFDETETYTVNNQVYTLLLGGAVPEALKGTNDSTYYTHYSALSTVQANWKLGSLGRQDTNKTVSNVFSFVANATGYKNVDLSGDAIPLTNATGDIPGPLNAAFYTPFLAPNTSAVGAGGGPVFVANGTNTSLTTAPAPVNLTSSGGTVPSQQSPTFSGNVTGGAPAPGAGAGSGAGSGGAKSGAVGGRAAGAGAVAVLLAAVAGAAAVL